MGGHRGNKPENCAFPVAFRRGEGLYAKGLTVREYMATHILAGLIASGHTCGPELAAPTAVKCADALLAALSGEGGE